jgi:hypothetical protein
LERTIEILKAATSFFARRATRDSDDLRLPRRAQGSVRFGVAPICAALTEHGCRIAPRIYYAWGRVRGTGHRESRCTTRQAGQSLQNKGIHHGPHEPCSLVAGLPFALVGGMFARGRGVLGCCPVTHLPAP